MTFHPRHLEKVVALYMIIIAPSIAALAVGTPPIVAEVQPTHLARVSQLVSSALGDDDTSNNHNRYASVRNAVDNFQTSNDNDEKSSVVPMNELVYGELSVPVLATILDAVGVQQDDVFLDIGSGDGALVLGASLLYASSCNTDNNNNNCQRNAIQKCYGVDIVPGLVERSISHANNLKRILDGDSSFDDSGGSTLDVVNKVDLLNKNQAQTEFHLGDIHKPTSKLKDILKETTFAICFATTWSAGNCFNDTTLSTTKGRLNTSLQGRRLPILSKALSGTLSPGCKVVIIDGKLDSNDGFAWMGDLRIQCPDTAPFSVATLYHKQ